MPGMGEGKAPVDKFPMMDANKDGSVSKERAHAMAEMGADIFVGGTAGIYRKGMDLSQTIPEMREAIDF